MTFPLIKNTTQGNRLLIFALLLVFGLAFSSVLGAFVVTLGRHSLSDVASLQILQALSQIIGFMMPPVLYVMLVKERPLNYLGFNKLPLWSLLGIVAMFIILPFNTLIAEWNEGIRLPEWMSIIEAKMQSMQEAAANATNLMMTEGSLVFNLLIIGVLAAVSEELLFRSVIQKSLVKVCKNPHVGIILTAVFFSAFHLEFYGFFPRLILGLMLGYMFYISGSIWSSILMHLANNVTIVLLYFMNNHGILNVDVERFGSTGNVFIILLSLITTVAIFMFCWRLKTKNSTLNS